MVKQQIVESSQRYFRIPFVRSSAAGQQDNTHSGGKRGWWYAHFDGQYVARQMELHPDKPPILLVAGKALLPTVTLYNFFRLTRKGTEVSPSDFDELKSLQIKS